ncbi:amino acid ABC transporter substrate-binding protein, PAAT family (TC 3.A.1.3.-) [Roseomonas rosea]|jgi:polar amino acid transport system substrate-binding protein|uniref:Amino acid ABC transporter substrate-binding protein, PAAT family (TC 3.A.1.3.-) n=1 Tax=Muricoccus roseus TaxID=198092 RepID=A0A1M6D7S6_9PROT|nr:transporter substrate-binding domain-containing protein [Roseomonas rosea]SHI69243.1 amino acid ABC transporter substrate-binding protein, PAAT family (TC 3.A.1.3.-) [Roseomonas rosea]
MGTSNSGRRAILGGGAVVLAAAPLAAPAVAQGAGNTLQAIRDRGELRVGVAPGEPWFFRDQRSEQWHGIGWGVAVAIARELNVKPVPVETTWGNAVAGLQAGQFDVMFVLDATPQRALAVDFPVQPMFYYAQGLLVRPGLTVKAWEDVNKPEIRLGVVLGTSPDRDVTARLPRAQIERFPTADETAAAFQAGRVDAISLFHPALVMLRARVRRGTVLLPEPVRAASTSAGVRREADKSWRDWLGLTLAHLYSTGETQKIYEEYLAFRGVEAGQAPPVMREMWQSRG